VHAGVPAAVQGAPFLPGPVFAAPYHWSGEADHRGYARDHNPTSVLLEDAIGSLDSGECVVFSSGMAACAAVLEPRLNRGDVLVLGNDGYFGVRGLAEERLATRGVEVRFVPTQLEAYLEAVEGATLVWAETPSNPRLDVIDLEALAEAVHAAGALLAVDNTTATPLGQQPLRLGADFAVTSATKALSGHSDLLLGAVSVREGAQAEELRHARTRGGAVAGPFETWLAHRSLATLGLRLERQSANALALAEALRGHPAVSEVVHPSDHRVAASQMDHFGPLVGFTLASADAAQAFLGACELVVEATSFGGVHSMAERRGRWGTDAVPEGFIRFSCGVEDAEDIVADVLQALG
jgi:cystathionine gamma-lyase